MELFWSLSLAQQTFLKPSLSSGLCHGAPLPRCLSTLPRPHHGLPGRLLSAQPLPASFGAWTIPILQTSAFRFQLPGHDSLLYSEHVNKCWLILIHDIAKCILLKSEMTGNAKEIKPWIAFPDIKHDPSPFHSCHPCLYLLTPYWELAVVLKSRETGSLAPIELLRGMSGRLSG